VKVFISYKDSKWLWSMLFNIYGLRKIIWSEDLESNCQMAKWVMRELSSLIYDDRISRITSSCSSYRISPWKNSMTWDLKFLWNQRHILLGSNAWWISYVMHKLKQWLCITLYITRLIASQVCDNIIKIKKVSTYRIVKVRGIWFFFISIG
jgi:hypothetical protein